MKVNKVFKRSLLSVACVAGLAATGQALAVNWLMLQGTEPAAASARAYVWGFIQAAYSKDYSDPNAAGGFVPPKMLGPDLNSQSGFNLTRARIGVRGTGFPLDDRVNYFALLEMGNNGTTHGGADYTFAKLTDASVTVNYIPGARIRAGLFKTPGSEEGLQGIATFNYIDFSEPGNQLLLERFPNKGFTDCTGVAAPCNANNGNVGPYTQAALADGASLNTFNTPVGAFRDVGVQVFDAFDIGAEKNWELSYAAMIGNGNGIEYDNSDGYYDKYLYFSAERKFGTGQGPFAEGVKFFGWGQWGKRLLATTATSGLQPYERNRAGLGVTYLRKPFRFTAEYINANGMIFAGPDKPNFTFASTNGADAKADGWYAEGGFYIPHTNFELDARYDTVDLFKGRTDEHTFSKWTLGAQYHINRKSRLTLNYEIRNFECTASTTPCTNANKNLDGVGNKIGLQLTAIF
jgi:hypothetical protein